MKPTIIALAALAAIATAAPLDKPLTVAVKEVSENTPEIKALWETYLAADLQAKSAQGQLEQARTAASATIRPEAEKNRMVLDSLNQEWKATQTAIAGLNFDKAISAHLADVAWLSGLQAAIEIKSELPQDAHKHAFSAYANPAYAHDTAESAGQRIAAKKAEFVAKLQQAKQLHAAAAQVQTSIAAQKQSFEAALAEANPQIAVKQTELEQAVAARTSAWNAYKSAVVAKLTADHPESAELIQTFAAER